MDFFKKIFGITSSANSTPVESVPQSWSVLKGENEGKVMLIRKNFGCEKIAGHELYNMNCGIAFKLLFPTADGLPNLDSEPIINQMEDEIFEVFESDLNSIIPIVISTSGFREFVIYTKDANEFEKRFEKLKFKYNQYELTCFCHSDPNWETYKSLN